MSRFRNSFLPVLILVTAILLVYGRSVSFELLDWDDQVNITLNPHINPPTTEGLATFWRAPYLKLYAPMAYTVFAFEAWLGGLSIPPGQDFLPDPRIFHAGNVLLHLLNSVLVFAILRALIRSPWPCCVGALLFALHPLQVESVCWVTEQRGLLSHLFELSSILMILKIENRKLNIGDSGAARWGIFYASATLLLILALLSKPSASVIPLMLFVLLLVAGTSWKRAGLLMIPWLVLAGTCILVTKRIQPDTIMLYVPPLWKRPFVAGDALAFYLWKGVWPLGLAADYGRTPKIVLGHWWAYVNWIVPAALLLATGGAAFRERAIREPDTTPSTGSGQAYKVVPREGVLFYAAILSLVAVSALLGLVPFGYQNWSTVSDRYVYLAMLGPCLALSACLAGTLDHRRRVASTTACVALAMLALLSFRQSTHWRNDDELFNHALAINPDSGLGNNYIGAEAARNDDFIKARHHLSKALDANPASGQVWNNMGMVMAKLGRYEEAMQLFLTALAKTPELPAAHNNLGAAYQNLGDFENAVLAYQEAVRRHPRLMNGWINLAMALVHTGRREEAIPHLQRAIAIAPDDYSPHRELGIVYDQLGRIDEAIAVYLRATELAGDPDLHRRLATLLLQQGELRKATYHFEQTLRLVPGDPEARKGLEYLQGATQGDGAGVP